MNSSRKDYLLKKRKHGGAVVLCTLVPHGHCLLMCFFYGGAKFMGSPASSESTGNMWPHLEYCTSCPWWSHSHIWKLHDRLWFTAHSLGQGIVAIPSMWATVSMSSYCPPPPPPPAPVQAFYWNLLLCSFKEGTMTRLSPLPVSVREVLLALLRMRSSAGCRVLQRDLLSVTLRQDWDSGFLNILQFCPCGPMTAHLNVRPWIQWHCWKHFK